MENNVEKIYRQAQQKRKEQGRKNKILIHSASTFIKGVLAGLMICIGCATYLSVSSKYLGSALFSISFIIVFSYGLALFSAKVCYFSVQSIAERLQLIPMWLGNFLGALAIGYILRYTRLAAKLSVRAKELCTTTAKDNLFSILLLSFFCGILIFIASDSFKNAGNIQKYLTIIAISMIFVLCGFEHSISSVFYFSISSTWSIKAFIYILVMTLGNALGGILIPISHKLIKTLRNR